MQLFFKPVLWNDNQILLCRVKKTLTTFQRLADSASCTKLANYLLRAEVFSGYLHFRGGTVITAIWAAQWDLTEGSKAFHGHCWTTWGQNFYILAAATSSLAGAPPACKQTQAVCQWVQRQPKARVGSSLVTAEYPSVHIFHWFFKTIKAYEVPKWPGFL